jgi:hypothetical protein
VRVEHASQVLEVNMTGIVALILLAACGEPLANGHAQPNVAQSPQPPPPQPQPVASAEPIDCGIVIDELNARAPNAASAWQCLVDAFTMRRSARMSGYPTSDEGQTWPNDYEVVAIAGEWFLRHRWDARSDSFAGSPVIGQRTCRIAGVERAPSGVQDLSLRECVTEDVTTAPEFCGRVLSDQPWNETAAMRCLASGISARRAVKLVVRTPASIDEYETDTSGMLRIRSERAGAVSTRTCANVSIREADPPELDLRSCR